MALDEKTVNELLDALTETVVENRALKYVLGELKQYLPVEVYDRLLAEVDRLKADPNLREAVADRFGRFRGQSIDDILPELLKVFPKIKS